MAGLQTGIQNAAFTYVVSHYSAPSFLSHYRPSVSPPVPKGWISSGKLGCGSHHLRQSQQMVATNGHPGQLSYSQPWEDAPGRAISFDILPCSTITTDYNGSSHICLQCFSLLYLRLSWRYLLGKRTVEVQLSPSTTSTVVSKALEWAL